MRRLWKRSIAWRRNPVGWIRTNFISVVPPWTPQRSMSRVSGCCWNWRRLSGLIALLITWIRLRSFRLAAIAMVVAVYSTAAALAILYYTGGNMNLVMTMLPPLVFVLEHLLDTPLGELLS